MTQAPKLSELEERVQPGTYDQHQSTPFGRPETQQGER